MNKSILCNTERLCFAATKPWLKFDQLNCLLKNLSELHTQCQTHVDDNVHSAVHAFVFTYPANAMSTNWLAAGWRLWCPGQPIFNNIVYTGLEIGGSCCCDIGRGWTSSKSALGQVLGRGVRADPLAISLIHLDLSWLMAIQICFNSF